MLVARDLMLHMNHNEYNYNAYSLDLHWTVGFINFAVVITVMTLINVI